jgi:hypothetical protein
MQNHKSLFEDDKVNAESVEDFLSRFYKPERFHGRGEDYAARLIQSYTEEFDTFGMCYISRHDSVTGKVVAYFGK